MGFDAVGKPHVGDFIDIALRQSIAVIPYHVSRWLATMHPDKAIVEGEASEFDIDGFVAAGRARATARKGVHAQITTTWRGPARDLTTKHENAWLDIEWNDRRLALLLLNYTAGDCTSPRQWVLADDATTANGFYEAVCRFASELTEEVLVFDTGHWQKSDELFAAIRGASFDDLVLAPDLAAAIEHDVRRFLQGRATYERYGLTWKRGLLFTGPPGNGKTHAIKALVNRLEIACLYVKSFRARYSTPHDCVRRVFARARQTTPCLLILEDLDALVDDTNRSYFLNELDGFAANRGIVTVATTNYVERLDPALVDRPSRFDRRYAFDLPAPRERSTFLTRWSSRIAAEMRPSPRGHAALVERTEGFSYAYLKELCLCASVAWIDTARAGAMDETVLALVASLRKQTRKNPAVRRDAPRRVPSDEDADEA